MLFFVSFPLQILTAWASAAWLMETQSRAATLIRWSSRRRRWSPGFQSESTQRTISAHDDGVFASQNLSCFNFTQIYIIFMKSFNFFCFSNSSWECSFHLRNYANQIVSESTKRSKWPPFITDSKLKLHASTKTNPPRLKPFCPKALGPTGAFSDLIWDSWTEKPLRPSNELLL